MFGDFDKVKELVEGAGRGRYPEIGRGVKRLSEQMGDPGYAMHCKGLELPAYLPDTNPGYPWAIVGHGSMGTFLSLVLEGDTSLDYWTKAITERGLYLVRDDLLGLCKFAGISGENVVQALKHEIGLEITPQELLAAVRRAFIRALWLERKQGYERSEYTLPSEVFDRPNPKLCISGFLNREFFAALSERVWSVFDREIAALLNIHIRLTSVLAERIGDVYTVDVAATTAKSALRALTDRYPELFRLLWISADVLNPAVVVFVNDRLVRPLELGISLKAGDKIDIVPAVAGG